VQESVANSQENLPGTTEIFPIEVWILWKFATL